MAAFGAGPAELMVLLMFLGGFGLPLGVPPEAENPAMAHVAPAKCVLYASWAGMAEADAESSNHTEQLLAEPEVQHFAKSLEKTFKAAIKQYAERSGDPKNENLVELAPLWTRTILTRSSAIFATRLAVKNEMPEIEGGILMDAGDDAQTLVDGLVQLLSSEDSRPEEVMLGNRKFFRFAAEQKGLGEITLGAAGPMVMIGVGKGAIEGMTERLKAKKSPAWLTELQKRLPVERRASVSYVNTKAVVDAFLPLAGPDGMRIAEALSLMQLGQFESVTGLDKEGMISRTFLKISDEPQGLLMLLGSEGIKPQQVDFIPRDATIAAAFSLNTQQIYNVIEHLVAEVTPNEAGEFEQAAGMFEEVFGMRLKEDVLASLGNVWTISSAPADGWLGFVATVEVSDRAKINELLKKVQGKLAENPDPSSPRIEANRFGEHEIQSLVIRGVPFQMSWCVADSRLIVGVQPQAVKSSLDLKKSEAGLFSQPEFASAFKGEGTTISIAYQDSAKVFETTYSYLTLVLPMMSEMMNNEFGSRDGGEPLFNFADLPASRTIHRHLQPGISFTRRTKAGVETESRQTFPTPNIGASAPVAVALLLPAVQAARSAARRTQSANNLKQIMLAMHNHHDTYTNLPPPYSLGKAGKPLLSWRVAILPFIEQDALYRQFHLDEPWDSEHNKPLIAKMPEIYKSPQSTAGEGKTVYLGVGGPKGVFSPPKKAAEGPTRGISFAAITDGTSNTIAVVEAGDESAVIWTKPDDYTPDEENPLKGLLGLYPGGFQVGICDGSVRFISGMVDPKMLMHAFQRDDGNVVDLDR